MNSVQKLTAKFSGKRKARYEIDMCSGSVLPKIIRFSLPLMFSSVLQLFFNAADIIVVGQYAGPTALAAVGSTGAVTFLIINVFMGLAVGTNVTMARAFGAGDTNKVSRTVHTSILISILVGTALVFVGMFLSKPLLQLMGSPDDVIDQATLYMRIYFIGMPASMVYNFGAANLRAIGDTKRPLYFLAISGVLNVVVNLILVIVFSMGVAGVAIATILAQYLSAFLVILCLIKSQASYKLEIKKLKIYKEELMSIVKIGIPAGIQGTMFSLSNTLIQSSINGFGSVVMAGSTAAGNLEGFIFVAMNALHQSAVSFIGQNIGAKKYSRINKIVLNCLSCVVVVGVTMSALMVIFGENLLGIYNSDPEVISYGMIRIYYIVIPYFVCGIMDVMMGTLRGMGYSLVPTMVSLVGTCLMRVVWVMVIFAQNPTLETLFPVYLVSWTATTSFLTIYFFIVKRKLPKTDG